MLPFEGMSSALHTSERSTTLILHNQVSGVLSLKLKKLGRQNDSTIDLSNVNPTRGHKEVQRPTGHIMMDQLASSTCLYLISIVACIALSRYSPYILNDLVSASLYQYWNSMLGLVLSTYIRLVTISDNWENKIARSDEPWK